MALIGSARYEHTLGTKGLVVVNNGREIGFQAASGKCFWWFGGKLQEVSAPVFEHLRQKLMSEGKQEG